MDVTVLVALAWLDSDFIAIDMSNQSDFMLSTAHTERNKVSLDS